MNELSLGITHYILYFALSPMQAHQSLPPSQQNRINTWIKIKAELQPEDMPQLIELARSLDHIERIINQIHALSDDDVYTYRHLTDLLKVERMRAIATNHQLGLNLGSIVIDTD